ncbi:hypothetical protein CsatB_016298 [Cannabis sativa]
MKKRKLYKDLSEEMKEKICKRKRERYAQKKIARNNAISIDESSSSIQNHFHEANNNTMRSKEVDNVMNNICETSTQLSTINADPNNKSYPNLKIRKFVNDVPYEASTLKLMPICVHCKAKRYPHETSGFCCANGKIRLAETNVHEKLRDLLTSNTYESTQFRTYIRTYNNKFAFTSFGVKVDKDLCRRNKGIYTFRSQGQIYHYINDLLPSNGHPSKLQLYFYDTDHELENRLSDSKIMVPSVVAELIQILQINPYSSFFRSLGDLEHLENQKIIIRTDIGLDQRVYNAPTSSQVAAIWTENDDGEELIGRDIFVYNHSGLSHKVQYYYGCYDPLQYPLLFPYGDIGWHEDIKRNSGGCNSTYNEINQSVNPDQSTNADELIAREERG